MQIPSPIMGGGDDVTTVLRFQFSCPGDKVTLEQDAQTVH